MNVGICGWLKRHTTAMYIIVFCTMGPLLIILTAFNLNSSTEGLNKFGIGLFVGGITYAIGSINKIPRKPISITILMLIIGLALIWITANSSDLTCKIFNGIGTGMCVGSITYFTGSQNQSKQSKQAMN